LLKPWAQFQNEEMNKVFTLVLLGAALIATSAFAEEAPKVSLEGRMDFMASYINQKGTFMNSNPSVATSSKFHQVVFVNDTKIDVKADGENKALGFTYGGMIRLHGDTSVATNREIHLGDKTMVYWQSDKVGRIEAGNTPGAGGLLEMEIITLNRGSWGIDGFWSQFITDKTLRTTSAMGGALSAQNTRSLEFIVSPNIPSNYSGHYYSDAPKVNFFTQPIKELTLGITYIDDLDSAGTVAGVAPKSGTAVVDPARKNLPPTAKEIVSGGFSYANKIGGDFSYKVNLVGEVGRAKQGAVNDLKAYEAGFMTTYKNMNFGASYGSWGKSFTLRNPVANAKRKGDYYTVAFSQDIDKFSYSVSYMESRKAGGIDSLVPFAGIPAATVADLKDNKFSNIVLDLQYQLAEGFLPYFSVATYSFKESTGGKDNGNVVIAGTRLLF